MVGRGPKGRHRRKRTAAEIDAGVDADVNVNKDVNLEANETSAAKELTTNASEQINLGLNSPVLAGSIFMDSFGFQIGEDGGPTNLNLDPSSALDWESYGFEFDLSSLGDITPLPIPLALDASRPLSAIRCNSQDTGQLQSSESGGIENGSRDLSDIILHLEEELGYSTSSIDRTMCIVKTSTQEIERIIQSRQWQAAVGLRLAQVAIDVALILFDNIVSRLSGAEDLITHSEDQSASCTLLLGQYVAESDTASVIWRRITVVELWRLRRLTKRLGIYIDGSSSCPDVKRPLDHLKDSFADQENKVGLLLATLQRHDQSTERVMGASV